MKWKLKIWWHYFFGKEPFKIQIGNYIFVADLIDDRIIEEVKIIFSDQISITCSEYKYEIIKDVTITIMNPIPGDTLSQRGTISWKTDVLVHTRKSWKSYLPDLIKSKIIWK